jgi:hypothetical protein
MNSAASDLDAILEGLLLRLKPWKGRQQRWMNVQDAIGKSGNEPGRQKTHIAGQTNQIHVMRLQAGSQVGIVFGALAALGDKNRARQSYFPGLCQAGCLSDVGNDDGDLNSGENAFSDRFSYGEEVRPAA